MAKLVAWVFGLVLLVIGVVGFVQMPVLGYFPVNTLHNLVHVVSGLLLIAAALGWLGSARMMLIILGVVYAVVAVLGFIAPDLMASLLNADMADAWLHIVFAVVFLAVGVWGEKGSSMSPAMPSSPGSM